MRQIEKVAPRGNDMLAVLLDNGNSVILDFASREGGSKQSCR